MSFDRDRRGGRGGRGRDKRDNPGGDFEPFDDRGGRSAGGFGGGGERSGGYNAPSGGGYNSDRGGGGGFGGGAGAGGGGRMPAQVVGEGKGIVKFFNAQKGFGFVVRDDGGEDVFVHISAVEQAGLTGLAEGQPISFTLVDRGGKVSASDIEIEGEPLPVPESAPREDRGGFGNDRGGAGAGGGGRPQRQLTGEKSTGVVKFFNAMKGFGFIQRDDGQPDAFVHISAVERAGMNSLNEGDRVGFDVEVDNRGKFAAVNLKPAD